MRVADARRAAPAARTPCRAARRCTSLGHPHVGAAGAGGLADGDERADLVVEEAGGEQVAGRVGVGVDDGHDRAAVDLADVVAAVGRRDRHGLRVELAGGDGGLEATPATARARRRSAAPRPSPGSAAVASSENGWARSPCGVRSCSMRSAAQMSPPGLARRSMIRPSLGQRREQPRPPPRRSATSSVDVEAPEAQVAEPARRRLDRLGRHRVLEVGVAATRPGRPRRRRRGGGPTRVARGCGRRGRPARRSGANSSFFTRRRHLGRRVDGVGQPARPRRRAAGRPRPGAGDDDPPVDADLALDARRGRGSRRSPSARRAAGRTGAPAASGTRGPGPAGCRAGRRSPARRGGRRPGRWARRSTSAAPRRARSGGRRSSAGSSATLDTT